MKFTLLTFRYLFCTSLILIFSLLGSAQDQSLKLQYDEPADLRVWEQALPIGNGRLGAMVYGDPLREEIQLNEETIWAGGPYRNDNPAANKVLNDVRQLIFTDKTREADRLINESFFTKTHGMPFQSAGSVILNFSGHQSYSDYYRELDIDNAVALSRYKVGDVTFTRQVFSSFADDVIVMQITASKKGALNFDLSYSNNGRHQIFEKNGNLVLQGYGSDHEGIPGKIVYQTHTAVKTQDGKVRTDDRKITISDATSVTLYISIGTNFQDYKSVDADPQQAAATKIASAMKTKFNVALKRHSTIFQKQFQRFKLNLGADMDAARLPTPLRIAQFQMTQDPSLVTLLTQYGRYLLICSSQPGGQPANLQGIWCNSLYPAWDSKYTININTEMNYWPAEVTNLSETHQPLIQMVKELSESGKGTARVLYNADGWVAHHNTDIWRVTSPIDFAAAGMWPTGGTWLVQHLWERYLYSGNEDFLREVYPVMKGASDFLLSTLILHPRYADKGWMVLSPSVSPEQGPLSAGVAMDNQLAFDMLTRTISANEILGENIEYREQLQAMAKRIAPMQIGKHTQLQEWLDDRDDPKNEHRHVSHLYALYPSNQISPYRTPELFEAARNSLIYRGDFATGWSIGWKINLWARLLDGNHAYKIVNNMLTISDNNHGDGRTYPNMFTAHPPFQIDGNFGLTAGVAEMLIQSHDGAVHLLPAIPDVWHTGSVSGIRARGGFEIAMNWRNGNLVKVTAQSAIGGNLRLRSYVPLTGKGLNEVVGENPNHLFNIAEVPKATISSQASLTGSILKKVYQYDINTRAGKSYTFFVSHDGI